MAQRFWGGFFAGAGCVLFLWWVWGAAKPSVPDGPADQTAGKVSKPTAADDDKFAAAFDHDAEIVDQIRDTTMVYGLITGTYYHTPDCPSLKGSGRQMTLSEAADLSLKPCPRCNVGEP